MGKCVHGLLSIKLCRSCTAKSIHAYYISHKEEVLLRAKRYYIENREKLLDNQRKRNFGISKEEYKRLKEKQGGKCVICLKAPKLNLAVDHNHTTGKIRELLCGKCNTVLGLMDENTLFLQNAIDYLRKHSG